MPKKRPPMRPIELWRVLWVGLRSLIFSVIYYVKLIRLINPLYVIYLRQAKIYHVTREGQIEYKPAILEQIGDMFKTDAAIRQHLLAWVRSRVQRLPPDDLTTCWHDGILLCCLVDVMSPGCCTRHDLLRPHHRLNNCRLGLRLAHKHLAMPQDIITAEEMATASEQTESKIRDLIHFMRWVERKQSHDSTKQRPSVKNNSITPKVKLDHDANSCSVKGSGLLSGVVGKRAKFYIVTKPNTLLDLNFDIRGPNREFCNESIRSLHHGRRRSSVLTGIEQNSLVDVTDGKQLTPIDDGTKFLEDKDGTLLVRQRSSHSVTGPDEQRCENDVLRIPFDYQCVGDNTYMVSYIPRSIGDHIIGIKSFDLHVPGSPFSVPVKDTPSGSRESSRHELLLPIIQSENDIAHMEQPLVENEQIDSMFLNVNHVGEKLQSERGLTKQRTVTKRRILKRVVTRSGKEVVIDVSPSVSRQTSIESQRITDTSEAEMSDYISDVKIAKKANINEQHTETASLEQDQSNVNLDLNAVGKIEKAWTNENRETTVNSVTKYANMLSIFVINSAFQSMHKVALYDYRERLELTDTNKSKLPWIQCFSGSECETWADVKNSIYDSGAYIEISCNKRYDAVEPSEFTDEEKECTLTVELKTLPTVDDIATKKLIDGQVRGNEGETYYINANDNIPARFRRSYSDLALSHHFMENDALDYKRMRHSSAGANPSLRLLQSENLKKSSFYVHQQADSLRTVDQIDGRNQTTNRAENNNESYFVVSNLKTNSDVDRVINITRFSESTSSDVHESPVNCNAGQSFSTSAAKFLGVSNPGNATSEPTTLSATSYFNDSDDSFSRKRRKQNGHLDQNPTQVINADESRFSSDLQTSSSDEIEQFNIDTATKKINLLHKLKLRHTIGSISSGESQATDSGSDGKACEKPEKIVDTLPSLKLLGKSISSNNTLDIRVPKAKISKATQVTYDIIKQETNWKSPITEDYNIVNDLAEAISKHYRVTENPVLYANMLSVADIAHIERSKQKCLGSDSTKESVYNVQQWLMNNDMQQEANEEMEDDVFCDHKEHNSHENTTSGRRGRFVNGCNQSLRDTSIQCRNNLKTNIFDPPKINVQYVTDQVGVLRDSRSGTTVELLDLDCFKETPSNVSHSLISLSDEEYDDNFRTVALDDIFSRAGDRRHTENTENLTKSTNCEITQEELLIDFNDSDIMVNEKHASPVTKRSIRDEFMGFNVYNGYHKHSLTKPDSLSDKGDFRALFVTSISDFTDASITATLDKASKRWTFSNEFPTLTSKSESTPPSMVGSLNNGIITNTDIPSFDMSIYEQLYTLLNTDGVVCDTQLLKGDVIHSTSVRGQNMTSKNDIINRASFCRATGLGLNHGTISGKNNFQVHSAGAGHGILTIGIRGPRANSVSETCIVYTGDNIYEITFSVTIPGYYVINIRWSDCSIPGSPYISKVTF